MSDEFELDMELIEAYEAAAAGRAEILLEDGRKISRLGLVGDLTVDGKAASELEPEERSAVAEALRQVESQAHLDPRTNPMIKIDP